MISAVNFDKGVSVGSGTGIMIIQFKVAPPIIAPSVSQIAGVVRSVETLERLWIGVLQWGDQIDEIIRRIE